MMNFCPEVAVLQSAFQLLAKQADSSLATLPKKSCDQFVPIIKSAVDEICVGLEYDLEPPDSVLWQQKLHAVLLYALVDKKYTKKEQVLEKSKIPVYDSLALLCQTIPTFSCPFYIEIVKQCNWTHLLLKSLQCVEESTAVTLLQEALNHCKCEPRTESDTLFFAKVTEELLHRFLSIPGQSCAMTQMLLDPLKRPVSYIQTVFPDSVEDSIAEEPALDSNLSCAASASEKKTRVNGHDIPLNSCDGNIWELLEKCPDIIACIMDCIEERTPDKEASVNISELLSVLSQEALLLYLVSLGKHFVQTETWLLHNVWMCDTVAKAGECHADFVLTEHLAQLCPAGRLMLCMEKSLTAVVHVVKESVTKKDDDSPKTTITQLNDVEIFSGVFVDFKVLLRMLHGVMSQNYFNNDSENCIRLTEDCMNCLNLTVAGNNSTVLQRSGAGYQQFLAGDSWETDISIQAMLWRLRNRLFHHEAVVEDLLSMDCLEFWKADSIYDVLSETVPLLSQRRRVLCMVDILQHLAPDGETVTHIQGRLLNLISSVFAELPVPDRDHIAMVLYTAGDVGHILGMANSEGPKLTNIFNKITADNSDKVLADVTWLCLTSPTDVVRISVEMSVKNDEQAYNFAELLGQVPTLCGCHHGDRHPSTSLLCSTIMHFLSTNHLSEKEEKHFVRFVSSLMKVRFGEIKQPVLNSLEFLHEVVLPSLNVDNLRFAKHSISCKFALTLLLTALDTGCNKLSDWSGFQDESVVLVYNLAGILNDCVLVWVSGDVCEDNCEMEQVSKQEMSCYTETGMSLLTVKQLALQCYDKVCSLVQSGYLKGFDNLSVGWLIQEAKDFHWSVRQRFGAILTASGYHKWHTRYLDVYEDLRKHLPDNLLAVLQFVSVDSSCSQVDRHDREVKGQTDIGQVVLYEELIAALVEILPNLLVLEFTEVLSFVECLMESGEVAVSYRPQCVSILPLTDLSGTRKVLCMSQILKDVILTLTLIPGERSRVAVLHHVLQCYVSVLKAQCEREMPSQELQLFTLSQVFHHVCEICCNLPPTTVNVTFVLLLHIATKFKDIAVVSNSNQQGHDDMTQTAVTKCKKVLVGEMFVAVGCITEECEEKQMLMKKLSEEK